MRKRPLRIAWLLVPLVAVVMTAVIGAARWTSRRPHDASSRPAQAGAPAAGLATAPQPVAPGARVRHDPPGTAPAAGAQVADAPRMVRGWVRTVIGDPIEGAEVTLVREAADGRVVAGKRLPDFGRSVGSAVSAADGTYEFAGVPSGACAVVARKRGHVAATRWVDDIESVDLTLREGALQAFVVVTEEGRPVEGASLYPLRRGELAQDVATTDAVGRADLVLSDATSVLVRASGFVDQTVVGPRDPAGDSIQVVVHEGRRIAGVVVDGEGAPLAGVLVSLDGQRHGGEHEMRTSADGAFTFDGLDPRPTEWELEGALEGWAGDAARPETGQIDARLVLRRASVVRGFVVREDGTAVPAGRIVAIGELTASTDEHGRFALTGVPPGLRTVAATVALPGEPRERVGEISVDVPEGGTVDGVEIVVRPDAQRAFVLLHVRDADGAPVREFGGALWTTDLAPGERWTPATRKTLATSFGATDGSGVHLATVRRPPGTAVVVAVSADRRSSSACVERTVATQAGPNFDPVVIRPGPLSRLRLRLVDPEGREVPFDPARVSNPWMYGYVGDGTYELTHSGAFQVTLRMPGFAAHPVTFDPPHPDVREETVRLVWASVVRVRAITAEGASAPEAFVTITCAAPRAVHGAGADDGGWYTFDAVPPGPAVLRVTSDEELAVVHAFDVPAEGIDLGDVVVPERALRTGVVVDGERGGVAGAQVIVVDAFDAKDVSTTSTRADGSFDLRLARGLPFRLRISRHGFGTTTVDAATAGADPLRIALGPAGRVRIAPPAVVADVPRSVTARRPGADLEWEPQASDESAMVYDDLPAGPVELTLRHASGEHVRRVVVVPGQTVECVFE